MKAVLIGIGTVALTLAAAVLVGRSDFWTLPLAELRAKYAAADSRFITIDGIDVHVRDSGAGEAVVFLHGSMGNTRMWDEVYPAAAGRYRIVNIDLLGHGLTGPDTTGNLGPARNLAILEGVIDRLNLGRISLVGTSSGGNVAYWYAAKYPERVDKLVLIAVPIFPPRAEGIPLTAWVLNYLSTEVFGNRRLKAYYPAAFGAYFADPARITDAIVTEYHDMNRRAGALQEQLAVIRGGADRVNLPSLAPRITAPTLLLWPDRDPLLPIAEAEKVKAALTGTAARLELIEGAGHFPTLEQPEQTARLILAFLAERPPAP